MNGVGLLNRGNTCYLNSALQLLGLVDALHKYIDENKWERDMNDLMYLYRDDMKKMETLKIIMWWSKLQQRMHRHKNEDGKLLVADPTVIRVWMGTKGEEWLQMHQQDAQEALGNIIDLFAEYMGVPIDMELEIPKGIKSQDIELHQKAWKSWESNYAKKYSIWTELFFGQEHMVSICSHCGHRNDQFDPFLFTFLDVDCLENPVLNQYAYWQRAFIMKFIQDPPIDDYKCDRCKSVGTTVRSLKWWKAPYYMMTVWKSFTDQNSMERASPKLILPKENEILEMSSVVEFEAKPVRYRLLGWVNHLGNLNGGHYRMMRTASPEWGENSMLFDDDVVMPGSVNVSGRAYVGLWKRLDVGIEDSDFWKVS